MPVTRLKETASQTAGPYVHIGCVPSFAGLTGMYGGQDLGAVMLTDATQGERIAIEGCVYDGIGVPLTDAMLEIWQADAQGLYNSRNETRGTADPSFTGWGRQPTAADGGLFRFETIKPGRVPWPDGRLQAPHITVWVVARGINLGLAPRIYFEDEAEANATDPVLGRIEHKARIPTLIAKRSGDTYRFDIHLQGPHETIFFDI
jgi:protocatechuate 3,4-dioxygenase alpha subunit